LHRGVKEKENGRVPCLVAGAELGDVFSGGFASAPKARQRLEIGVPRRSLGTRKQPQRGGLFVAIPASKNLQAP